MKIAGPISLREFYNKKYNKRIYIFGDRHEKKSTCWDEKDSINIDDYILFVIKKYSIKTIDVFIEIYFDDNSYLKSTNYMHSLADKLSNCLKLDKSNCEYENLRVHYSDTRGIVDKRDPENIQRFCKLEENFIQFLQIYMEEFSDLVNLKNSNFKKSLSFWLFPRQIEIINEINNMNVEEIYNIFINRYRIDKNIKKINFPVTEDIKKFSIELIEKYKKNVKKLIEKSSEFKIDEKLLFLRDKSNYYEVVNERENFLNNYLDSVLSPLYMTIIYIISMAMDIYVLSRIFKKFDNSKGKHDSAADKIIMYVGEYHAERYSELFEKIGFEQILYMENENQCLEINEEKYEIGKLFEN